MTVVAVVGLGVMGAPMARNLLAAGHDVIGYSRTPATVEAFVAAGGRGARSLADLAAVEAAILMLPDGPDVRAVALGDGGLLTLLAPGSLLVDMSTVDPAVARELAAVGGARGVAVLDAPVSGGESAAVAGSLSVMVGGAAADFERAGPLLAAVGTTVVHVGGAGSGQTVKAANQLVVGGTIGLLAEAIVLLEAYDIDVPSALRVLGGGLAGSAVLERKGAAMLARDFEPGFRVSLHHKDLGIATAAARRAGVAVPLGAATAQLVGALVARGDGDLDHGALLRLVADLSGRGTDQHDQTSTREMS